MRRGIHIHHVTQYYREYISQFKTDIQLIKECADIVAHSSLRQDMSSLLLKQDNDFEIMVNLQLLQTTNSFILKALWAAKC